MISKSDLKQIKLNKESLNKPTPDKWKKIGRTISRFSKILSGAAFITANPIAAVIVLIVGEVGETIVDFASE